MFYTGILAIMLHFKTYFLLKLLSPVFSAFLATPRYRNCLSPQGYLYAFNLSLQHLLTQDSGLRCCSGSTRFFVNQISCRNRGRTLTPPRPCLAEILWFALGVWLSVCDGPKPFNFGMSTAYSCLAVNKGPLPLPRASIWTSSFSVPGPSYLACIPAFHFRSRNTNNHYEFTAKPCKILSQAGFYASKFSGHSFRRGGATYAFRCRVPVELISLQGDWSSDTVHLYIAQPLERRLSVAKLIAKNISPTNCPSLFLFYLSAFPCVSSLLRISFFSDLSGGLGEPHQGPTPSSFVQVLCIAVVVLCFYYSKTDDWHVGLFTPLSLIHYSH